jgi:hypothetical protein
VFEECAPFLAPQEAEMLTVCERRPRRPIRSHAGGASISRVSRQATRLDANSDRRVRALENLVHGASSQHGGRRYHHAAGSNTEDIRDRTNAIVLKRSAFDRRFAGCCPEPTQAPFEPEHQVRIDTSGTEVRRYIFSRQRETDLIPGLRCEGA